MQIHANQQVPSRTGEGFSAQNAGEGQKVHVHSQKTKAWHEATLATSSIQKLKLETIFHHHWQAELLMGGPQTASNVP